MGSIVGIMENRISELEDRSTEFTQYEQKREKSLKTTRSRRWMGQ